MITSQKRTGSKRFDRAIPPRHPGADRADWQLAPEYLFKPLAVLPCQFFFRRTLDSGERRLLLAILTDAINCYLYGQKTVSTQAEYWFTNFYQNERRSFASFYFICELFNIDPHTLWNSLQNMRHADDRVQLSAIQAKKMNYKTWRKAAI